MDPKPDVIIYLAVAMGANCIPCFDHLYSKVAKLGIAVLVALGPSNT